MFRISRRRPGLAQPGIAQVDLSTLRETLRYMKTDADRVPGLEGVSQALDTTLREVDRAECKLAPPPLSPLTAKFLPRRRS